MTPLTLVDDEPEQIDPLDQDRRMNAVLVPMQCLMYGAAMKWESSFSSGKPTGGERPPGEAHPLHTEWQQRYVLAAPEDREQVIADATDALVRYRCGPRPEGEGETTAEWEQRMIEEGEGADPDHVALVFNCLPRMVRKIRVRFKREPEYGRIIVPVDAGERRALLEQLVNVEGVSMRAAAMRLGVNYSTVLRDLGKKAA